MTSELGTQRLKADGRNRALRVFLNGLVVTVLGAAAAFITDQLTNFDLTSGAGIKSAVQALAQTALMAGVAYLLRTKLDPSVIPTPLPPEDPGPPAEDVQPTPPITAVEESGLAEDERPLEEQRPRPVPYARLRENADARDTQEIPRARPEPPVGTRAYALWLEEQQARGRDA